MFANDWYTGANARMFLGAADRGGGPNPGQLANRDGGAAAKAAVRSLVESRSQVSPSERKVP